MWFSLTHLNRMAIVYYRVTHEQPSSDERGTLPMSRSRHFASFWRLTLFEKVICFNALMLLGEAAAGLWVTSHNLESHHYLIDTGFIVVATVLSLLLNTLLLRASFRPLFSLLQTIRLVSSGKTEARSHPLSADSEICN